MVQVYIMHKHVGNRPLAGGPEFSQAVCVSEKSRICLNVCAVCFRICTHMYVDMSNTCMIHGLCDAMACTLSSAVYGGIRAVDSNRVCVWCNVVQYSSGTL